MPWPKGKPRSPETCLKMSIGMKGKKAWNKGKHPSEETLRRQSEAQLGRILPPDVREKIAESHRGKPRSEETKRKLSESRKGIPPWNKGIPFGEESKKKLSESQKKRMTPEARHHLSEINKGPKSTRWLGGVSYSPYCPKFNEEFKERIRDRFNRSCFLCNSSENGRKLAVHHIDYNKTSICNGQEWAFVSLCNRCHSKTNGKRWYWFNLLINYWALNPEINF